MPEITLRNITKRWGKFYGVDHLNLDIADNSFITLLGPSGCGKTTILRMIAGLETPTTGQIKIGDKVVFDSEAGINIPANKRKVGFLFQNYALYPNMTVYENMAFSLKIRKQPKDEVDKKVHEAAKVLGIEHLLDRKPAALSGGQKQRLCIARALLKKPKILILDDSTSAVDTATEAQIRKSFSTTLKDTTKLIIAQRISSVEDADRILVMDEGQIVGQGTHKELLESCETYQEIYYSQRSKEEVAG